MKNSLSSLRIDTHWALFGVKKRRNKSVTQPKRVPILLQFIDSVSNNKDNRIRCTAFPLISKGPVTNSWSHISDSAMLCPFMLAKLDQPQFLKFSMCYRQHTSWNNTEPSCNARSAAIFRPVLDKNKCRIRAYTSTMMTSLLTQNTHVHNA